jgi:hypothetical protein
MSAGPNGLAWLVVHTPVTGVTGGERFSHDLWELLVDGDDRLAAKCDRY